MEVPSSTILCTNKEEKGVQPEMWTKLTTCKIIGTGYIQSGERTELRSDSPLGRYDNRSWCQLYPRRLPLTTLSFIKVAPPSDTYLESGKPGWRSGVAHVPNTPSSQVRMVHGAAAGFICMHSDEVTSSLWSCICSSEDANDSSQRT